MFTKVTAMVEKKLKAKYETFDMLEFAVLLVAVTLPPLLLSLALISCR